MRTRLSCAFALVLWLAASAAAQSQDPAPLTGSHSVTTGNRSQSTAVGVVEVPSGPYRRAKLGTGLSLSPRPIPYFGTALGLPSTWFPMSLKVEFCEHTQVNAALLATKCPTATWWLDRTVKSSTNYEKIEEEIVDASWFDPMKKYVLIWRDGDKPIRYSTPITFKPRVP